MPPPRVKAIEKIEAVPVAKIAPVEVALGDAEPKQDPMQGVKTPAWRAWLKRSRPEEYKQKFGEDN